MELDSLLPIDSALRGATAAMVCLSIISLLRDAGGHWPARLGALFGFGVLAYLVCSAPWFMQVPQPIFALILFFCIVNPVLFWLLGRAVFDDGFKPALREALLVLAIGVFGYTKAMLGEDWHKVAIVLLQLISVSLVGHLLFIVMAGRKDDLIAPRRKFRLTFVGAIGAYILLIAIAELSLAGVEPSDGLRTFNTLGLLIVSTFVTTYIVRLRSNDLIGSLMQVRARHAATPAQSPASDPLIDALHRAMAEERYYRTEALSIGQLADHLKVPEYRLRQAINQNLGFRNFAAFLNSYRLAEAKTALADPEQARTPILSIALGLGYASIGPFNRAFKDETGMTPSQYRNSEKRP